MPFAAGNSARPPLRTPTIIDTSINGYLVHRMTDVTNRGPDAAPRLSRVDGLTRREFVLSGGALAAAALVPSPSRAAASRRDYRLVPSAACLSLVGAGRPPTALWCFNGQVPGPEIRVRLGQSLGIAVDNRLDGDTTVHWHGLRIANAMDGVPGLTQPPIAAGASFAYEFTPPDAGTFWYHPHVRSSEQQGRGLHGVLIVDEPSPIAVDRELVWVLDD